MPRIRADRIEEHKRLVRKGLYEAAQQLFLTYGYEAVSQADLAASAGIARTTFYEYFSSKEDLLASLVEEELPAVFADMVEASHARENVVERLSELARRMLEFVGTDHVLGLLLHREVPKLPSDVQLRIAAAHSDLGGEFERLYSAGVEQGVLKELPGRLGTTFIHDVIMAAAKALIAMPEPKEHLDAMTGAMFDLLFGGLSVADS